MRVEETFCNKCANKSKPNYSPEESEYLYDLGVELPDIINYDY